MANESYLFTRNILTDLNRALSTTKTGKDLFRMAKVTFDMVALRSVSVRGRITIHSSRVRLCTTAHATQFMAAARWFVRQQSATTGGWAIPVQRSLSAGRLTLAPGWLSAMAQGHGISVLCRAYAATGNRAYFDAALRALAPFAVNASEGGVRNYVFGHFVWYEEYPTSKGTFVLNGFIYALVGLYDLIEAAKMIGAPTDATSLLNQVGPYSPNNNCRACTHWPHCCPSSTAAGGASTTSATQHCQTYSRTWRDGIITVCMCSS